MDSILISIKKLLGIDACCDHFDTDVILHINSALMILNQLGVGPPEGFVVTSNAETWTQFLGDTRLIESAKTYVYLRVKLVFDPPQSSAGIESFNKMIAEYEWRLNVAVDPGPKKEEEEEPDHGE